MAYEPFVKVPRVNSFPPDDFLGVLILVWAGVIFLAAVAEVAAWFLVAGVVFDVDDEVSADGDDVVVAVDDDDIIPGTDVKIRED